MIHGMKDYKMHRAIRDEWDHTISQKSFMTNVELKRELDEIEAPVDERYSLDAYMAFGCTNIDYDRETKFAEVAAIDMDGDLNFPLHTVHRLYVIF